MPDTNLNALIQKAEQETEVRQDHMRRTLKMYGGLLLFVFALALAYGVYAYATTYGLKSPNPYEVIAIVVVTIVALISSLVGAKTMLSDASKPKVVIPAEDRGLLESLIREGNEKGIVQYVRLSSLSGTTGTATKLGLTGLPLATVGLTIFFSVVAMCGVEGFLDLAKLTLGAFIGSFVQRNVTGERMASEGIKIVDQSK